MTLPGTPRPRDLVTDGIRSAVAQRVPTVTAALVVALVCLVVLLTTGRTAATERAVVDSIDLVGSRLITVTDSTGQAYIDVAAVDEVSRLSGVDAVLGLGPVRDGRNRDLPRVPVGVPVRPYVGDLERAVRLTAGRAPDAPRQAAAGTAALAELAMDGPAGAVTTGDVVVGVVGEFSADGPLASLDGSVLTVPAAGEEFPLRVLYVVAAGATDAARLAEDIEHVLPAREPTHVDIAASTSVLQLREVVTGTLGAGARLLMAGVLVMGLVVLAVTMFGAVAGRRRDFGRRRALGASRSSVVVLVLVQAACAGTVGVTLGTAAGVGAVVLLAGSAPGAAFVAGLMGVVLLVTLLAAVPPAVTASRRDPVSILRVP
ncbi:FtsX-like permease family protein [Cellulomonas bogoriensis]|uniref:ABC3 transporter permease C-terminal domain-containing protein n=1 Tax=Cellulomonas bogoriensis 69B4 = DSM 16987 TaxID=1386082 RepID=A0A0A0BZU6_9CELL|nr:FtsX-like permease family protein [Cellulomonas bogoriensis]KGM13923.1 hypothetical protein N869_07790 [Cellulomonas bogoriensis 69B4 = DSM 16987]